ncbi:RluA family pseudouridine synthase [Shimazuella kribbensis]|uniref:RluA family pseudouridine synthase n=1 Tax=Shimazuella kribbensis TaxID=139808 RepID=UPI00041396E5|nr:RluA family pseudouridine synthase [Shimazuella kribbensis]
MHKRKRKSNTNQTQSPTKQYTVKEPTELLVFLLDTLSNLGRNSVKSLLSHGQVLVNDQAVTKYNFPLQAGQTVSIRKVKVTNTSNMTGIIILHEDEDIIVIEKESGLLSVSSSEENEITAYRQLMDHVRRENPKNRIFVVHRLDRDTSGVMMFAKSQEVQQIMQNSWKDMVKERLYIALVEGSVKKKEGTIKSWLKETKTFKTYSSARSNDGKLAVTHYKVIKFNSNFSLLKVNLDTGRKNQIRVHMQDIGHSIVGDKKYGSRSKPIGRLGLHAQVLSFMHPITGHLLRFETKIPKLFLSPFRGKPTK